MGYQLGHLSVHDVLAHPLYIQVTYQGTYLVHTLWVGSLYIRVSVQIVDVTFTLESSVFQDTSILHLFCASVSAQSKGAYFNIFTLLMSNLHSHPLTSVLIPTLFTLEFRGSLDSGLVATVAKYSNSYVGIPYKKPPHAKKYYFQRPKNKSRAHRRSAHCTGPPQNKIRALVFQPLLFMYLYVRQYQE